MRARKGIAPDSAIATGRAFPGWSRPLRAYPKHAPYTGIGNSEDAQNFRCQKPRSFRATGLHL